MNPVTKIGCLMVILLGVLGCQRERIIYQDRLVRVPVTAQTALRPEAKTAERCSTKNDQSLSADREVQVRDLHLEKHEQRVIRKDCEGRVLSDKVETVQDPNEIVEIFSRKFPRGRDRRLVHHGEAFNRTTCQLMVYNPLNFLVELVLNQGLGYKELREWIDPFLPGDQADPASIKFNANYSPTIFNGEVDIGPNYIDYEFFGNCQEPKDDPQTCINRLSLEKGTLVLNVTYESKNLDGVSEIKVCDKELATPAR